VIEEKKPPKLKESKQNYSSSQTAIERSAPAKKVKKK
jgi:hypothetical protein